MKMASVPNTNDASFNQKLGQCLILMIKEQSSQKKTLEKLLTETRLLRENVSKELKQLHDSIGSINRMMTSGKTFNCETKKPVVLSSSDDSDGDIDRDRDYTKKTKKRPVKQRKQNFGPHTLPMGPDPPRNVHKPTPRPSSKSGRYNMVKHPLPHKAPIIKPDPQESDFIDLMKSVYLEVNRTTIAAVSSVVTQVGRNGYENIASRLPALNTILIVDTSESMQGQPLQAAKAFVNKLLDDIDTSAGEFGLEEYISVVTCGESVGILEPFTNDFVKIRSAVEKLRPGGRTPLMTSLVLSLCYLELQSECVRMVDHVIMPRLIVISDFDATLDTQRFSGQDANTSEERIKVQRELFKLGMTFKNRGYTMVCVPVGQSNDSVAKEFVAKSKGDLIKADSVQDVGCYFRYQMLIGRALAECDAGLRRNQELDVYSVVKNSMTTARLDQRHETGLMTLLEKVLEKVDDVDSDEATLKPPEVHSRSDDEDVPYLPEWNPSRNLTNISLEEQSGLPSIGSRVKRGKDWVWENHDSNQPGTIVGHKKRGIVVILWDNGNLGNYRHGYEGKYDVETTTEPRHVPPGGIEVGCSVIRGADWNRGDEDGGKGTIGVVIRKESERYVLVRWPSGVIETYRFGAHDKWELEVTLGMPQVENAGSSHRIPRSPTPDQTPHNSDTGDLQPWWSFRNADNMWVPFSEENVEKIEAKYQIKDRLQNVLVEHKNKQVRVFLSENQCEIEGVRYQIKREMLKPEDIESVKLVLQYL